MRRLVALLAASIASVSPACGGGSETDSPVVEVRDGRGGQGSAQAGASGAGGAGASAKAGASAAAGGSVGQSGAQSTGGAGRAGQAQAGGAGGEAGSVASGGAGSPGEAGAGGAAGGGGEPGPAGAGGDQGAGGEAGAGGATELPECPCFVQVGWCGQGVAEEAASMGCTVPILPENEGDLLACDNGAWTLKEACAFGCNQQPKGTPDTCKPPPLPECPCFVESSWCGTGAAKEAEAMGCTIPLLPGHASDLLHCPGGVWAVKEDCAFGCNEAPKGTADTCKSDPSAACTLASPPHAAQLTWGLHPDASDALRSIGVKASGISQTIGNAAASAGTHGQDGTADGLAYSAATDLRTVGKSEAEIHQFLDDLARVGFVAWYRKPGYDGWPSSEAPHIHAIWVGAKMKLSLRNQVRDFMEGKNGLASHTTYKFHTWSQCWRDALWQRYLQSNPASG